MCISQPVDCGKEEEGRPSPFLNFLHSSRAISSVTTWTCTLHHSWASSGDCLVWKCQSMTITRGKRSYHYSGTKVGAQQLCKWNSYVSKYGICMITRVVSFLQGQWCQKLGPSSDQKRAISWASGDTEQWRGSSGTGEKTGALKMDGTSIFRPLHGFCGSCIVCWWHMLLLFRTLLLSALPPLTRCAFPKVAKRHVLFYNFHAQCQQRRQGYKQHSSRSFESSYALLDWKA